MGRDISDLSAVEGVLEGTLQRPKKDHPKNAQDTVAFRKGCTNFMCHWGKGFRLLSEEARKTGLPHSKHKYLKEKKGKIIKDTKFILVCSWWGKKPYLLIQRSYLQRLFMSSDMSKTKIRDNTA